MAMITYAAIDISAYDVNMRIYEISGKNGIKQIDEVTQRMELGKEIYAQGKISNVTVKELCRVLKDFGRIMKTYRVDAYRACAATSLREAENVWLMVEQVFQQTEIQIELLSNSERRFLGYKSIASREEEFTRIMQDGTAVIEVGGGSVQVSLFEKNALVTTQSFRMGNLHIRERLLALEQETVHYERIVKELIWHELSNFKKMHVKDREIKNIILMGNTFVQSMLGQRLLETENSIIDSDAFERIYKKVIDQSPELIAVNHGIPLEYSFVLMPTLILYHSFIEMFGAKTMWFPDAKLNDGMVYEYAEKKKLIKSSHNFENDIIAAAKNIGKRYGSSKSHVQSVMNAALVIFDSMKKVHGMGARERLLLQIAVLLHDCGKYISQRNVGLCSYEIILNTEIIGLSLKERKIIANVVKFLTTSYEYYGSHVVTKLSREEYMLAGKLTAILRVAAAVDCAHQRKIKDIRAAVKDNELIITAESDYELLLETGMVEENADFFEEVYALRPRLRRKRVK